MVPHLLRVGRGRAAPLRHHPDLRGLHGLARLHRREDRGRPEGARRLPSRPSTRPPRHQPRAQSLAGVPHAGRRDGRVGRLPDEARRGLLRHQLLPEAHLARPRLPAGAPRARDGHGARRDGRRGVLRRRTAVGLRRARHHRGQPDHAGRPRALRLGPRVARGAVDQLLRVLPDEHRLRGGRLRADRPRRHAHAIAAARRAPRRALIAAHADAASWPPARSPRRSPSSSTRSCRCWAASRRTAIAGRCTAPSPATTACSSSATSRWTSRARARSRPRG